MMENVRQIQITCCSIVNYLAILVMLKQPQVSLRRYLGCCLKIKKNTFSTIYFLFKRLFELNHSQANQRLRRFRNRNTKEHNLEFLKFIIFFLSKIVFIDILDFPFSKVRIKSVLKMKNPKPKYKLFLIEKS
jgi:hypothetical protein